MNVKLKQAKTEISSYLSGLKKREAALRSFLNTTILQTYKNAQMRRWMTENESEGKAWDPPKDPYKTQKLERFKNYPGGGRKTLIATSNLLRSVIGAGPGFQKVIEKNQLIVRTAIEYAGYVNEARNFTTWSKKTSKNFDKLVADFLFKGIRGGKK